MNLRDIILRRARAAGAALGGLAFVSLAQSPPAQAQMGVDDQPNTLEEVQPVPSNVTDDQPNSVRELRPVPLNDSDRVSRLRALQQGILTRNDGMQETASASMSDPMVTEPTAVPSTSSLNPAREQGAAIAIVTPMGNELESLSLMNDTGTTVTYEVVGDTTRRMLMAGEAAMLQGIPLPATITVVRQDEGLLDVSAMDSEEGMLQLSLTPEPALDSTQGVIRIQEDGQVFVN